MIILGIDPGTAALGYGVVERTGGRLRAIDHGCLVTSPDLPMPERLLAIHGLLDELLSLHEPAIVAVERLFFSATPNEVKSAIAGYGAADKEQVQRMVQLVLGMAEVPRPDDAADALAIAVCIANRIGQTDRVNAAVFDRAAVAPIQRGESPYERAIREAIVAERKADSKLERPAS